MSSFFTHYRTTIFGVAAAVLNYMVTHAVGPIGLESTLLSVALLLGGASAADAAIRKQ